MTHITLVRHGQANSGARDEQSYDRLSPLGHQQSRWLGQHLRASRAHHARVFGGTLRRHLETAQSMGVADGLIQDARLNELEYFTLAEALEAQHGVPIPTEREGFAHHLPQVFAAWRDGRIENPPETFAAFQARVSDAINEIAAGDGAALVVTSGGVIARALSSALALDIAGNARLALAVMNTSLHRLFPLGGHLSPVLFNAVPHLEAPERHFAQTHL